MLTILPLNQHKLINNFFYTHLTIFNIIILIFFTPFNYKFIFIIYIFIQTFTFLSCEIIIFSYFIIFVRLFNI